MSNKLIGGMRNGDGIPWCISEFSDPEVLKADAELLVELGTPEPWVLTPEQAQKDEEARVKACEELEQIRQKELIHAGK